MSAQKGRGRGRLPTPDIPGNPKLVGLDRRHVIELWDRGDRAGMRTTWGGEKEDQSQQSVGKY